MTIQNNVGLQCGTYQFSVGVVYLHYLRSLLSTVNLTPNASPDPRQVGHGDWLIIIKSNRAETSCCMADRAEAARIVDQGLARQSGTAL